MDPHLGARAQQIPQAVRNHDAVVEGVADHRHQTGDDVEIELDVEQRQQSQRHDGIVDHRDKDADGLTPLEAKRQIGRDGEGGDQHRQHPLLEQLGAHLRADDGGAQQLDRHAQLLGQHGGKLGGLPGQFVRWQLDQPLAGDTGRAELHRACQRGGEHGVELMGLLEGLDMKLQQGATGKVEAEGKAVDQQHGDARYCQYDRGPQADITPAGQPHGNNHSQHSSLLGLPAPGWRPHPDVPWHCGGNVSDPVRPTGHIHGRRRCRIRSSGGGSPRYTFSVRSLLRPHRGLMMARVPQIPVTMLEISPRMRVMEKPCSGPEPME